MRRERLLRDLPRALQQEEARVFAAAKKAEAAGDKAQAERLFESSRKAFQAQQEIARAAADGQGLDEAIEKGNQLLLRLANSA